MRPGTWRSVVLFGATGAARSAAVEAPAQVTQALPDPAATMIERETDNMASRLDYVERKDALGIEDEVYAGNPPAILREVAQRVNRGGWPLLLNVKGFDVMVVTTLAGWEAMQPVTGFEAADGDA